MTAAAAPQATGLAEPLLVVQRLRVVYRHATRRFVALDGVDITVAPEETVAVVGESGAGKSTLGRAVLGLVPVTSGSVHFAGHDVTGLGPRRRAVVAAGMQVVFQDPYSSLNPSRTVRSALVEPMLGSGMTPQQLDARVAAMLERVGLPADTADRYPRQFSGGQRQRIAIARSLMVTPRLLVCDEALSALDLSVQAQIINLLIQLRSELGLAYLFIGHDLAVVRHLAHRVVVLRRGSVVEEGPVEQICSAPQQRYTEALMAAAPVPDPGQERARLVARAAQLQGRA